MVHQVLPGQGCRLGGGQAFLEQDAAAKGGKDKGKGKDNGGGQGKRGTGSSLSSGTDYFQPDMWT